MPRLPQQFHISFRLSTYYAASFLIVGIKAPFWPVWLAGRGLDARQVATVLAASIWAGVVATPALGAFADRFDFRRGMMIGLCLVTIVGYASLWHAYALSLLLGLTLVAAAAQTALMPLGDSITLAAVRRDGIDYGRVRVWGSVSFILAAVVSGVVLSHGAFARSGGNTILALVLIASTILLAACVAIPTTPPEATKRFRGVELRSLARDKRFWQFVAVAATLQASHQVYYGFGTLYWRSLGFSDGVIGVLWAEGVVAEIALFWQGSQLLMRFGPLGLMILGGGAGVVRWALMGIVPGLLAAVMLQLLHALTFGATHLGAMNYLSRTVPPGAAASAQALYSGASSGIGSGLVMLGAGSLYAAYGAGAYLAMATLSAIGLIGAVHLARSAPQRPHFL